jgi:hypothetical protein
MVSKINLPTVECKNLQSAFRNPDIVDNLIKQEVDKGYLKGAFEKPPFDMYRVLCTSLFWFTLITYNFSQFVSSYMMDSQEQLHYSCNTTFT